MRIDKDIKGTPLGYRIVIITLDSHSAGPCDRAAERLISDFPGLSVEVHAAAEWGENPNKLSRAKDSIAQGDIILVNLLFLEEHVSAILPSLKERRDNCDAMGVVLSDSALVGLTQMGSLDMSAPQSGMMSFLK